MLIVSNNVYLKKGLGYKLSNFRENNNVSQSFYKMIIYDRGDGVLLFVPVDIISTIMSEKYSFYKFITHKFVSYDRIHGSSDFEKCICRALRNNLNVKIKALTDKEVLTLDLILSSESLMAVSKKLNNLNIKTMYSRKYNILEKIGVKSIRDVVKLKKQWDVYFNQ